MKNQKNLWTTKFKDMSADERKLMRKKIINILIFAFVLMVIIVAILPKNKTDTASEPAPTATMVLTKEQKQIKADYINNMKKLYTDLQSIKNNPEFLKYGFAKNVGQKWYNEFKKFDNNKNFHGIEFMTQIIPDIDVLSGDLVLLAKSYFSTQKDNKYIETMERKFNNLLNNY